MYEVYRKSGIGFSFVARCMFLSDAETIYKNWHSAYIVSSDGEIIKKKNL